MSTKIEFETPENIRVAYRPAGLGTRFLAWFVDNILMIPLIFVIFIVLAMLGVFTSEVLSRAADAMNKSNGAPGGDPEAELYALGLGVLVMGLGSFFYFGCSELLLRGQTLGKRWSGIRVVRLDGFALEPGGIFIRSLFRVVDHLPPLWIVPLVSARSQRLGDMVAGTVVVADSPESISDLRQVMSERPAAEVEFRFDNAALQRARREDIEAVEKILERWEKLTAVQRQSFLDQLVPPIAARLKVELPPADRRLPFLYDLLAAEYRRQHRRLG